MLLTEASLARKQRKSHATFIPLMVSEMPQAGDLVGLDAEFVTLNQVSQDCNAAVFSPLSHSMSKQQYVILTVTCSFEKRNSVMHDNNLHKTAILMKPGQILW